MKPQFKKGQFVHIVASVTPDDEGTEILYVNPSSSAIQTDPPEDSIYNVELQFTDANDEILSSYKPVVQMASYGDYPDDHEDAPKEGLINESLPYVEGVKSIVLLVDGDEKSRYTVGNIKQAPDADIALAGPTPDSSHRHALTTPTDVAEEGVTYTVQARPSNDDQWQVISVGQTTPNVDVNVNQFPSASRIMVRVLKTNGFDEEVVSEEEIVVNA